MWSLTCVPTNVYSALYKFKPVVRCVQARHFSVSCWLLMALILDNGKGKLKDLGPVNELLSHIVGSHDSSTWVVGHGCDRSIPKI
jgi:hypothetical protein